MPDVAKVAVLDLQPRTATLKRGASGAYEGSYTLSLTNARGIPIVARVEVRPGPGVKPEWISIPKERSLFDFAPDKTEQIPITVQVPAAEAGKKLGFEVLVTERGSSDEAYDKQSAEVVLPPPDKPGKTGMPGWLIPVIVGGVLVLGGVVFAVVKLTGKSDPAAEGLALGEACDPKAGLCAASLECAGGKCVGLMGVACTQGADCLTGQCKDKKCGPLGLRAVCDPKRSPSLCAEGLACPAGKCLAAVGGACSAPGDCVTNQCAGAVCLASALKVGDACTGDCGATDLSCQGGVCKGRNNRQCTAKADCISDLECLSSTCQPSGLDHDTTRIGASYRTFTQSWADPQLCRQTCLNDQECKAFNYRKPNSGSGTAPLCSLMAVAPPTTRHICCVSGVVQRLSWGVKNQLVDAVYRQKIELQRVDK